MTCKLPAWHQEVFLLEVNAAVFLYFNTLILCYSVTILFVQVCRYIIFEAYPNKVKKNPHFVNVL